MQTFIAAAGSFSLASSQIIADFSNALASSG